MTDRNMRSEKLVKLEQALDHLGSLIKELREMEQIPMAYVLAKVPGETILEKSAAAGVSRQTYWYWMQGRSRPSRQQATKLAKLTGIPMMDIMTVYAN